jgi:hypothetical protein
LIFSVSQDFDAYEYFVCARFAQMFRRRIEFPRFIVGAAREKTAQIRLGYPRQSAKSCFFIVLQADCDGSPCVKGILVGFPCGLPSWPADAFLSYCFTVKICDEPAGSRTAGRTPRRHRLRVFCATPSRKRRPEPVIGAVLHCMSELTG